MMKDEKIRNMLHASKSAGALKVGFLLVPNFSMIAFSCAIEPLRSANRMSGCELFSWVIAGSTGETVIASNGVVVSTDTITGYHLFTSIHNRFCMMATEGLISLYGSPKYWPKSENPQYEFFRATQRDGYFKVRLK